MLYRDRYELSLARAAIVAMLVLATAGVVDVPEAEPLTWARVVLAGVLGLVAFGVINRWGSRFADWFGDFWWRINREPPDPSAFVPMSERKWPGPGPEQRKHL